MKKLKKARPECTFKNIQYQDEVNLDMHIIGMMLASRKLVCIEINGEFTFLNDELVNENWYDGTEDFLENMNDDAVIFVFETRREATAWLLS